MSGCVVHVNSGMPFDVYAGRAAPRQKLRGHLYFANNMKVGVDGTREEVLEYYERYARDHIEESPDGPFVAALRDLRGKTLACWCADKAKPLTLEDPIICHGQILLVLAEELANDS